MTMRQNARTPEGVALGVQMARLCDGEIGNGPDLRCRTCAFRRGEHLANGSPETLMSALKCALEGEPFYCHERAGVCRGWQAMRSRGSEELTVPWDHIIGGNYEAGDVIPLPDLSGD